MKSSSSSEGQGLLTAFEAEAYILALEKTTLKDVGSDKWIRQHNELEKLNIQAHHAAISRHDEFIVDFFIVHDKIGLLLHELLVVEIWRDKILPHLLPHLNQFTSMKAYMVLYHEATLCNLLEVLLFHQQACQALASSSSSSSSKKQDEDSNCNNDTMLEFIDYCMRRVVPLLTSQFSDFLRVYDSKDYLLQERTLAATLTDQSLFLQFRIALASLTMLRFLTDALCSSSSSSRSHLFPMSTATRLLNTHDLPVVAANILLKEPWKRTTKKAKTPPPPPPSSSTTTTTRSSSSQEEEESTTSIFNPSQNRWEPVTSSNANQVCNVEAQLWLILYNLLCDTQCRAFYDLTMRRQEQITQLKRKMNELLFDQLPPLTQLRRVVEEMSVLSPPPVSKSLLAVIETEPTLRSSILPSASFSSNISSTTTTTASSTTDKQTNNVIQEIVAHARSHSFMSSSINSESELQQQHSHHRAFLSSLSSVYSMEEFEDVLEDPHCSRPDCGKIASQRCSRCHIDWYCSRPCQVKHWNQHKSLCDLIANDRKCEQEHQNNKQQQKKKEEKTNEDEQDDEQQDSFSRTTVPRKKKVDLERAGFLAEDLHMKQCGAQRTIPTKAKIIVTASSDNTTTTTNSSSKIDAGNKQVKPASSPASTPAAISTSSLNTMD